MSKILYPIFKLPSENEDDVEYQAIPTWIKWWMINNYKKRNWILSEILTGNPLTLENSVETKFYLPPYPRGNSEQDGEPTPDNEVPITNVTGDVEVLVQNKNLFDLRKSSIFSSHISAITDTSTGKSLTISSGQTTGFVLIELGKISNYAGKTLTLSLDNSSLKYNSSCFVNCNSSGGNRTSISSEISSTNETTFTVGEDYTEEILAVRLYVSNATGGQTYNIDNIQIEEGTTATTYTPHQEQTYTFPLGTQRMYLGDYLADDGIHHVKGQVVLDGTEKFTTVSVGINSYALNNVIAVNYDMNKLQIMSNYFKGIPAINRNTDETVIYVSANNQFIIRNTSFNSITELKTWIAEQYANSTPLIVQYELAEEEITPYTTEQQQAYDEIKQAFSYDEQTNISGSSDEAMPLFEVQYYMINESEGE